MTPRKFDPNLVDRDFIIPEAQSGEDMDGTTQVFWPRLALNYYQGDLVRVTYEGKELELCLLASLPTEDVFLASPNPADEAPQYFTLTIFDIEAKLSE